MRFTLRSKTDKQANAMRCALVCFWISVMAFPSQASFESINQEIENALIFGQGKYGRVDFDTRYRYEYVDQDGVANTANASTIRLRLGYLTPEMAGFQAFAEFEGVGAVFHGKDYNSIRNGNTNHPVVADPTKSEVNRLWVNFSKIPDTVLKIGRQRITYNNQRFIGNVGWRQLEQTYDSGTMINQSPPDTKISFSYIGNVRDVTARNVRMHSPILNISYDGLDFGKLTAYGYWLNYHDADDSLGFRKSSKTFGIRFHGASKVLDNLKASYTTEFAHQSDYKNNPLNYHATYHHFGGGLSFLDTMPGISKIIVRVDWEDLGSDKGFGFQTPLATLHAFQGWADIFLLTHANGVSDLYGTLSTTSMGVKLVAVFHDFHAANGGQHYGREFDALIAKKFGKHYAVALKYAIYDADTFASDTEKIWFQMSVKFRSPSMNLSKRKI